MASFIYDIGPGGMLTKLGVVRVASHFIGPLAFDSTGRYAYTISLHVTGHNEHPFDDFVTEYAIRPKVGLVTIGHMDLKGLVGFMATDPHGPYMYITRDGGHISEYRIGAQGRLGFKGSVKRSLSDIRCVTINPTGKYLYAAQFESLGVDGAGAQRTIYLTYDIGPHGRLAMVGAVATGAGPRSLAIVPR